LNFSGKTVGLEEQQDYRISMVFSAYGALREGLANSIGLNRMKGFLIHYGWKVGVNEAKKAMESNGFSLDKLLRQGPVIHRLTGQVESNTYEADFEIDSNQKVRSVFGKGSWSGSYEAAVHVKRLGISDTPVCHSSIGFLSGYLSTVCGQTIIAKEVACEGMGHSECRWVLKTLKDWDHEILDELQYYRETLTVEEIESFSKKLHEQSTSKMPGAIMPQRFSESSAVHDLQLISDIIYEIIEIPIVVEDIHFHTKVFSGLEQEEFSLLDQDYRNHLAEGQIINRVQTEVESEQPSLIRNRISGRLQDRIIVPIIIGNNTVGYCHFIYHKEKSTDLEAEYARIEGVTKALSVYFQHKKTSFDAFAKLKRNFLEKFLSKQYASKKEILKRARNVNLNLNHPYQILVLGYAYKQGTGEHEFLLHEEILEDTSFFLSRHKLNAIAGQYEGNIVLLAVKECAEDEDFSIYRKLIEELEAKYKNYRFKIGISSVSDDIESAQRYYEEAAIALRMSTAKKINLFSSLGVVGVLINSMNMSAIKTMAKQLLGPLYGNDDPKNQELIKTLYVFLLNGGKLEPTMKDLSLSMSGLLYRLQKIENAIKKDIRHPIESHQLFLILESLIAIGELNMEL
jgi:hypothetical protein